MSLFQNNNAEENDVNLHDEENSVNEETAESKDEQISSENVADSDKLSLSSDQLNEMLHQAYLRGRNENIEARIESDCATKPQRSVAGELLIKGLTGVAKAIFSPGRRSIWPPRRK